MVNLISYDHIPQLTFTQNNFRQYFYAVFLGGVSLLMLSNREIVLNWGDNGQNILYTTNLIALSNQKFSITTKKKYLIINT